MGSINPFLWYRDQDSLKIGGVSRYTISYTNINPDRREIYYRLKNVEKTTLRAIHLLNGPFILYCHIVPYGYNHNKTFNPEDLAKNKEIVFKNQIKPGQTLNVTLKLNSNSFKEMSKDGLSRYQWEIDIISQIVITSRTSILYDLMIGEDLNQMRKLSHGSFQYTLTSFNRNTPLNISRRESLTNIGKSSNPQLQVVKQNTEELWSIKPNYPDKPVHLIIITHGIFSNLTADMLYLKDSLQSNVKENIIVKGFENNAGKTEIGIKKLGIGCANYLIELISELNESYNINKISFIGHSLGGLVQLYAMKHILMTKGNDYFEKLNIQPINLICVASPLLGILSEMSLFISWFLDLGTLGKTGRDLTLSKKMPNLKDVKSSSKDSARKRDSIKPLLEVLPDEPLQTFLSKFKHLTLYANAVNDGITPLRTSALLYLDYEALGDVTELKMNKNRKLEHTESEGHHQIETSTKRDNVGEIPEDNDSFATIDSDKKGIARKYKDFLSLNFNLLYKSNSNVIKEQSSFDESTSDKASKNFYKSKKKKLTRKEMYFLKINAKGSDLYELSEDSNNSISQSLGLSSPKEGDGGRLPILNIPPRASAIESAISTILCPIPSYDYIMNPESRDQVIFHDKYYHFKNLPIKEKESEQSKKNKIVSNILFHYNDWKLNKQVKIANKYHTPRLKWRKVLVNLPPDAHNNIIVRRRFVNSYGWGVVDHLCKELFDTDATHNAKGNTNEDAKSIRPKIDI